MKYAVRRGDFKMIIPWKGGDPQLYNLREDIGEAQDVADSHPETVQELDQVRMEWDSQLIEPRFLGLIHTPEWQAKRRKNERVSTEVQ